MNARTVCYFGLARDPQRLEAIMALLPDDLKADCERVIEELRQKDPAEWKTEWAATRRMERKMLTADIDKMLGGKLSALPAQLQRHLLWRAVNGA
jgi:hypothetical protein